MSGSKFSGGADGDNRLVGMHPTLTRKGIPGSGIAISLGGVVASCAEPCLSDELSPHSTPEEVLSTSKVVPIDLTVERR